MDMRHLSRIGDKIPIPIPADEEGFTGRECPNSNCEGYFKIQFGTGLKGESIPCHCPYCGFKAPHDQFWTKKQIEYAKSVVMGKISEALYKDLKSLEFEHRPKGDFGIGFSLKVHHGRPVPIRYYREKKLETEIICDRCTLRYAIFGLFAFCPDCGAHNSQQILEKNLEVTEKELELSTTLEDDLSVHLIQDALENIVSAFDGFGRETCRVRAISATDPPKAKKISFQNIERARQRVQDLFGVDFSSSLDTAQWSLVCRGFMKRHLLAHRMGVVDQQYVDQAGDTSIAVGRKISIHPSEVQELLALVRKLGKTLANDLPKLPS